MLIYALAVWTALHTLVYIKFMKDICVYVLTKAYCLPSMENLRGRGYKGARLVKARDTRLTNVLNTSRKYRMVYYLTKGSYILLSPLVSWILYQVM